MARQASDTFAMPSDTTVQSPRDADDSGTGEAAVAVRPVESVGGERVGSGGPAPPQPTDDAATRLHRLVLETRVATLEAQLEHKQRELEVIRSQYERVIDSRGRAAEEAGDDDGFSWPRLRL